MTVHTLKPSYVEINYHSVYGSHKMILPTRQWSPVIVTASQGSFTSWNDTGRDADDMINDLVDELCAKFPDTVSFDQYTIWNFDEPSDFFIPVAAAAFVAKIGLDDDPGWTEAVQSVMTMFDTEFNTVKLVLLDMSSRNNFARRTAATADADELAIFAEFSSSTNAWASRAGFQPNTLRSVSLGINDELKKQYSGI